MRITATGYISMVLASTVTFIFNLRMGATGGVSFFTSLSFNSVSSGIFKNKTPFRLDGIFTIRTVGKTNATTGYGIFKLHCEALVGSPLSTIGGSSAILAPITAPASSSGIDSTVANMVYLESRIASTSQIIQMNQYVLEALN